MSVILICEATMLICFGVAWPLANLRMLRHRRAEGRGTLPTALVLCGYLAGMSAKLLIAQQSHLQPVFWLYLLNACSVALNLHLQRYYGRRANAAVIPSTA
jgi:hypothetical protein